MAWTEPKVNWESTDFCTVTDVNRIMGNVEYLLTHGEPSKVYNQNDIWTLSEFNTAKNKLIAMATIVGVQYPTIEPILTANTLNNIETLTANLKTPVDMRFNMIRSNKYAGKYYTGRISTGGK